MSGPARTTIVWPAAVDVEERLVARLLHDLHLGGSTLGRAVQADEHLLRADAELELSARRDSRAEDERPRVEHAVDVLEGQDVHGRAADERADEAVDRAAVDLGRSRNLLEHALVEHGHAIAERQRLHLVVRDVDHRRAEPLVELLQLGAHAHAQLGVEVGERLVEEVDVGPADERSG